MWIPAPADAANLLGNLTFDRVPGHLWLRNDLTLSHALVAAGCAAEHKPPRKHAEPQP